MQLTKCGLKRDCGFTELINQPIGEVDLAMFDPSQILINFHLTGSDGGSNYSYFFTLTKHDIKEIILTATEAYRKESEDDLAIVSGFIELLKKINEQK